MAKPSTAPVPQVVKDRLSPRDKIAAARMKAKTYMPYFIAALLKLVPREQPGLGTVAVTDRAVLLYDPMILTYWTVDETAVALIHEIMHLLRDHSPRCTRMGAEPKLWNIAADMEINDDIVAAKLKLPNVFAMEGNPVNYGEVCTPEAYGCSDGSLAEDYYRQLQQKQAEGKGIEALESPAVGKGFCGSCGGRSVEGEPGGGEEDGGRTRVEIEGMKKEVARAIEAHQQAKGRSSIPHGMLRWAQEMLTPPKVRWQDKLARCTRNAVEYRPGATDFRMDRPSRRQVIFGHGPGSPLFPRSVHPIPEIMVVVDTSGSMGREELTKGLSELSGIFKTTGGRVTFCACDAEVHSLKPINRWQDALGLLKGGGGTDFCPVFDEVKKMRPPPEIIAFVTDGFGPAPVHPPIASKVIWLLVGAGARAPATWGESILLED